MTTGITPNKLYGLIEYTIPPFLFTLIKKIPLYKQIKSSLKRFLNKENNPSWHIIESGNLKGLKLFIDKNGIWQQEMLSGTYDDFFFKYLETLNLEKNNIFDIGAHIGYHSLYFSQKVGEAGAVLSFEPNMSNFERMNMIIKENNIKNIKTINKAISKQEEETQLVFSDGVDSGVSSGSFIQEANTLLNKNEYESKGGFSRMKISVTTIDNVVSKEGISPDLIKIDVEGAEYLVLLGGKEYIRKHKPIILMEIHSTLNMFNVTNFLKSFNYNIELLKEESDGRCFIVAK